MSILNAITAGAGGVALTGDTSGNLTIQSAGTNVATFTTGGNLNFQVSNAGISFNNSGAIGAATLNDYETGTWTPTDASGAGLTISQNVSTYTKIGRMVYLTLYIGFPVTANGNTVQIGGLPFNIANISGSIVYAPGTLSTSAAVTGYARINGTNTIYLYSSSTSNGYNNASFSNSYIITNICYLTTF